MTNKGKQAKITNKLKQNKGITLVALVVTIVVLILLAVISIQLVFNEDGIIQRAERTKAHQANAEAEDLEKLEILEAEIESKEPIQEEKDITKLTEIQPKTIKTYDENKDPVIVPKGFKVRTDLGTNTKTGIVIEDSAENQFVWVPVRNISEIYDEEHNAGQLWKFSGTTSSKMGYSTTSFREPDVVTKVKNPDTEAYDIDGADMDSRNLEQAGFTTDLNKDGKVDDKDFKIQLQNEFNSMIESVKKYGGFYIGRYETGNLSLKNGEKAVVQKGNTDISNQTWYTQYKVSKTIATNNNVTTSMIWGSQWEATLRWMQKEGTTDKVKNFATNSANYGNYKDNSISYVDTDKVTKTTTEGTGTRIPAGSAEITNINNIYDMAGNVFDWTIEAYDTSVRVLHGGFYDYNGSSYPAGYRDGHYPTFRSTNSGCRATLYIK